MSSKCYWDIDFIDVWCEKHDCCALKCGSSEIDTGVDPVLVDKMITKVLDAYDHNLLRDNSIIANWALKMRNK